MKKEKQDSAFSQLMNYAGSYKMFTYTALVLSAVSAVLALFPFVYLWRIIKAVINAHQIMAMQREWCIMAGWRLLWHL